ncbi:zinc finger matrin-type protein 5 [Latimeria chalumnae]|uniref:Zinc finger matrin-type protein 5 n=1 Tax=Latimeria chalumnae TaxID=7897 RepID=H2ZWL9_LATCH|nr:PREDICTED: zinc finger matrin-type protein 5 [Latimeria chalumnae]|eukprot:XP_006013312.1 PREDICTED: zinc finger matrin-type protein 5 [Latimeria chalumnae]
MGKRYYCDYCDRSFQDNPHNRKKHLNGIQHHRARKLWYDSFRDATTILSEEQNKKPCRKFQQTGHCDYGSNCKFSHLTDKELEKLQLQIDEEHRGTDDLLGGSEDSEPNIEEWLLQRTKRMKSNPNTSDLKADTEGEAAAFQLPLGFPPIEDLPPSLHPLPPEGWTCSAYKAWG